jgi:hypothetical protein
MDPVMDDGIDEGKGSPVTRPNVMKDCDVCRNRVPCAAQSHDTIHFISAYGIFACGDCYADNHDGWNQHVESAVTRQLRAKGLAIPARQTNGRLPRDG